MCKCGRTVMECGFENPKCLQDGKKFKVGDKVELVKRHKHIKMHAKGTVLSCYSDGDVWTCFDNREYHVNADKLALCADSKKSKKVIGKR